MSSQPTFQIGITMAGAISAGAYSAGVMDFLFQALDGWYRAKQGPDAAAVPSHAISINVISGASAGAITAALAPAALRFGVPDLVHGQGKAADRTLASMYRAWVVRPDMLPVDGHDGLLAVDDLKRDRKVVSMLNSSILGDIGTEAFALAPPDATLATLPYVSETLHLYLTVTNLRGVPYEVKFTSQGSGEGYGMLNHGDRVHFAVDGLGASGASSTWALKDPGTTLRTGTLPAPSGTATTRLDDGWQHCLQAALASSAFPVGLAPRHLETPVKNYQNRAWPFPHDIEPPLDPDFPPGYTGDPGAARPGEYRFTCVDGGLIDNEPFEYAHYALMRDARTPNPRRPDQADRAVLMIDPFPEPPAFDTRGDDQADDILSVLMRMFLILKDQSRFKPAELAAAMDDATYSRFLVAPRRHATLRKRPGEAPKYDLAPHAIASGLLGGFGGFFHRAFRDFDYQLGRRNCQKFLRETFVLDASNPVVAGWPAAAAANPAFGTTGDDGTAYRCILPLVGRSAEEIPALDWPRLPPKDLDAILDGIRTRLAVMYPLLKSRLANRFGRLVLGMSWGLGIRAMLLDYVEWSIKCDLIRRDQYGDPDYIFDSEAERTVIGALADPSSDLYPAHVLARDNGLADAVVDEILKAHARLVYRDDTHDAWALAARRRGLLQRMLKRIAGEGPKIAT